MNVEKAVMIQAGAMVLLSLFLAVIFSLNWLWLTAFVGAAMIQAPITGFCPPAMLYRKLGLKSGPLFDRENGSDA